jgi:hypothetical protein
MAYDMNKEEILESLARVTPQWLAGFFDGEGSITTHDNGGVRQIRVILCQKDIKVLALISFIYGGNILTDKRGTSSRLYWSSSKGLPFLQVIKDHVICKKRQVDAAIEFMGLYGRSGAEGRYPTEESLKRREELSEMILRWNHEI